MYNSQFRHCELKLDLKHYCCWVCDGPNELQQCILLGASYVQRVVYALNDYFPDNHVLNVAKFLSPCYNPSDDNE